MPIGIEILEIFKPLGLFQLSRTIFVGSLSLIIDWIELIILVNLLSFRTRRLIRLILIPFLAWLISLIFWLIIFFYFFDGCI